MFSLKNISARLPPKSGAGHNAKLIYIKISLAPQPPLSLCATRQPLGVYLEPTFTFTATSP